MPRLSNSENRRIEELERGLATWTPSSPPPLAAVISELHLLLEADLSAAFGVAEQDAGLAVDWLEVEGGPRGSMKAELQSVFRANEQGLLYDPRRPPPDQSNRVLSDVDLRALLPKRFVANPIRRMLDRIGVPQPTLRMLICEQGSLLGYLGMFRDAAFNARERTILGRLLVPLHRRLWFDRFQSDAGPAISALCALLDDYAGAALLAKPTGEIVLANQAVGELRLRRSSALRSEILEAIRTSVGSPRYRVVRLETPGVPTHFLLLERALPSVRSRSDAAARSWSLTPRQTEVLELVVRGASNKDIAVTLGCAVRTVEVHVTALLEKAGCGSRAALAARVLSFTR